MPHITILLASYNGADHIQQQLDSFSVQTHVDWTLRVSDDGSTDNTKAIIQDFASKEHHDVKLVRGPRRGSAANFLSLLSDPNLTGGWVALSDQDDVWLPEKLERAVSTLAGISEAQPALYCSRTELVSPDLQPLGPSRQHKSFKFSNAVVQNVVAGNTVVLNPAALDLVRQAGTPDVRFHDWWLYLLMSGAGATIRYDSVPTLLYRQHTNNELGENRSLTAKARRAGLVGDGTWSEWVDANLDALASVESLLTPETRARLAGRGRLSSANFRQRVSFLQSLRPWRQSSAETVGLYTAILAGRV